MDGEAIRAGDRTRACEYLSSVFANLSPDIRSLFVRVCVLVGVRTRVYGERIRICRRPGVRLLLERVGTKS